MREGSRIDSRNELRRLDLAFSAFCHTRYEVRYDLRCVVVRPAVPPHIDSTETPGQGGGREPLGTHPGLTVSGYPGPADR